MKMAEATQVLNHRNQTYAADSFIRLNKLRREGILCDLTILVQGQKFKAHKVVMAASSDYFLTAICGGKSSASVSVSNSPTGSHMTIELQYVTMKGFVPLLEYAYSSDLNVSASDVIDVLAAASYMQMFEVANACSEFMRSNLLSSHNQSRLAHLPLLQQGRSMMLNRHSEPGSESPVHGRSNVLPEAMNNLLQATSMMPGHPVAPTLGRPPMLLPISSMIPYDVNIKQWADTMAAAGTQSLISHLVNGRSNNNQENFSPSTLSPASPMQASQVASCCKERRRSSLQPQSNLMERPNSSEMARSEGGSPLRKPSDISLPRQQDDVASQPEHQRSNHNENNNTGETNQRKVLEESYGSNQNRESVAVKVESTRADEMASKPSESEDAQKQGNIAQQDSEDSWQSLQKLYSFQNQSMGVPSPTKGSVHGDETLNEFSESVLNPSFLSRCSASANGLKMVLNKYKDGNNGLSMVSSLSGLSMHRALLHQQQLLAAQQQQQQQQHKQQQFAQSPQRSANGEVEKLVPELPAVPPGGQYMSVRRRTLQSNVPKPHQCQICGSRFTRYHNLKQHIKLHSGVKPYECDECGKRFTRNYTLRLHKMKHGGLRNFRCGTCDNAFTSLGEFRAHLRMTMHSHLPANGTADSPQMTNDVLEPEDLSNAHLHKNAIKFGQFEYSLLNYGVDSPGSSGGGAAGDGSSGTTSPPGNMNSSLLGMDSPQMSDRSQSASPQDLSTKRLFLDSEGKRADGNDSDSCRFSPKSPNQELQLDNGVNKRRRLDYESSTPA